MRSAWSRSSMIVFVVGFVTLVLAGCGAADNRGAVTGKVTLNGQPLEKANISFVPIEGTQSPSAGGTVENGAYAIARDKGPMAGVFKVEIRAQKKTGRKIAPRSALSSTPGEVDETVEAVPAAYNSASKLRVEIKAGNNVQDFELTSP